MIPIIPRIETIPDKKLVGIRLRMRLSKDRTVELFRTFMRRRREIVNALGADLFCVQAYDDSLDFKDFNLETEFDKWAAVEVSDFGKIPENLETHILEGGLYAVFTYRGLPRDFPETFRHIFYSWLPASDYELDKRDHFDLLGDTYKNNDPSSEEEVWIPIKGKA